MKKIVLAFSCVFLMNGFALADDNRYKVVRITDDGIYVIVDTKKERLKDCGPAFCKPWRSWDEEN